MTARSDRIGRRWRAFWGLSPDLSSVAPSSCVAIRRIFASLRDYVLGDLCRRYSLLDVMAKLRHSIGDPLRQTAMGMFHEIHSVAFDQSRQAKNENHLIELMQDAGTRRDRKTISRLSEVAKHVIHVVSKLNEQERDAVDAGGDNETVCSAPRRSLEKPPLEIDLVACTGLTFLMTLNSTTRSKISDITFSVFGIVFLPGTLSSHHIHKESTPLQLVHDPFSLCAAQDRNSSANQAFDLYTGSKS
jgi:hypothetical protein